MTLENMNIAAEIKREAANTIARIEHATGMLDATMAGGIAEGFLIGLVCVNAITADAADELEALFGDVTDQKMISLRKNG
jgi:hypothetical protein